MVATGRDPKTLAAARQQLTGIEVMLFRASSDSSFMTGEEIVVDGGMTRV